MITTIHKADTETIARIKEEMAIRKTNELFLLFGMGSQTDGLIYMKVSGLGVYCVPANPKTMTAEDVDSLKSIGLKGIIISGGPYSVSSTTEPPPFDNEIFSLCIPTLGICLGFHMWAKYIGAKVLPAKAGEFNPSSKATVTDKEAGLFRGVPESFVLAQSHNDEIQRGCVTMCVTALSENGMIAGGEAQHLHGIQGHPEKSQTVYGQKIFENFCFAICGAQCRFPTIDVVMEKVDAIRSRIGKKKVLIALSGGVDSTVTAELIHGAVGDDSGQVRAVYLKGLDRKDDEADVIEHFGNLPWLELKIVDFTDKVVEALRGITTGTSKRKAIKGVYVSAIQAQIDDFGAEYVAQGTNFADLSESGGSLSDLEEDGIAYRPKTDSIPDVAQKARIKDHHNIGNKYTVREIVPVVTLVKDGIRAIGRTLGIAEKLLFRHPFPGPGLGIRIDGEVTKEKLSMERDLDGIWIEEIRLSGKYYDIWEAGVDLLPSEVTLSRGDDRGWGLRSVLWAVTSVNGFTANPYLFDPSFLSKVAVRIGRELPRIGSVSFEYMPKPPKTIEQC